MTQPGGAGGGGRGSGPGGSSSGTLALAARGPHTAGAGSARFSPHSTAAAPTSSCRTSSWTPTTSASPGSPSSPASEFGPGLTGRGAPRGRRLPPPGHSRPRFHTSPSWERPGAGVPVPGPFPGRELSTERLPTRRPRRQCRGRGESPPRASRAPLVQQLLCEAPRELLGGNFVPCRTSCFPLAPREA